MCCPWCGSIEDSWFTYHGGKVEKASPRHGFVRDMEHTLLRQDAAELAFRLDYPGDGEVWPWAFRVDTVHTLVEGGFETRVTVTNRSDEPMPLQFGFHPGLRCPFLPESKATDYQVRFESGQVIALTQDIFDNDSICYTGVGKWARLEHRESGKYIEVNTEGYLNVLLWSKPGIPGFMCIEPWSGFENHSHDLLARPGAEALAPGGEKVWLQRITARV